MRPLTAEIKNNKEIPSNSIIRDKKNILPGNIYIKKNWCKVKCVKSARMGRNVSEVRK